MKTKNITLCGKEVTIAYCFATELAYKDLTDEDYAILGQEIADSIENKTMPDTKKVIALIYASCFVYYDGKNQEPPISIKDIMNEATPDEIAKALGTVIGLRVEFYHIPTGEPADTVPSDSSAENKEDGSKN